MKAVGLAALFVLSVVTAYGQTHAADRQFTFVRVNYGGSWATDYPDAELELTKFLRGIVPAKLPGISIAEPVLRKIGDADLKNFPLLYFAEPSSIKLSEEQARQLREYSDAGGMLMFDDFWGDAEWTAVEQQVKLIFPGRTIADLPIGHSLFHVVYEFQEFPQVPTLAVALRGATAAEQGIEPVHYREVLADDGRIQALLCFNTDLGDGWERAGETPMYSDKYSLTKAFPMGANIVAYAMKNKK